MTQTLTSNPGVITPIREPAFAYQAALYFLDGHYLFVRPTSNGGQASKFVTVADVAAAFTGQEEDTGWLPAGVVRAGRVARGRFYVYSAPEQKITLTLEGDEAPLSVPIPRTVLLGLDNTYYLWAIKSEHFDPRAQAFQAPFPNLYEDGKVCWGSNTPPRLTPGSARKVWELFFSTPFNQHLVGGKSLAHKTDVRIALRGAAGKRRYPAADLLDTGSALDYRIKRVLEG